MKFDTNRLEKIKHNKYFQQEMATLNNNDVKAYYNYIIDNITIDDSNTMNSYIMWACCKVNTINDKSPSLITPASVALPDIDMDVPAEHRDEVIDYIKQKYGESNVSQMITFGRLQGRAAIKEVLRINEAVSFAEMNAITNSIPDEAKISDQLELMEEKSIIKWALENEPDSLRNWCFYNDNEELDGPLANLFEQAIKIEGTNKSQGKHPAGVIISKHKLDEVCPMTNDKSGDPVVAFEMNALEYQGHIKFDVLGIDLLSKIMEICDEE